MGGRLVFVRGEAAAGKSMLVRRFCERRERVLWGACDELFAPPALGPFVDIARIVGGGLQARVANGGGPYEVLEALRQELERGRVPVLVIEDVHWADEATLDVLRLLGRRIEGIRALVIATYRDDELGREHPLRVVVGALATAPGVARVNVLPLSPEAVAELAAPHSVDADELYRVTGGNPFFVVETLAAGSVEIPGTVRDAVLARVACLRGGARALLEPLAVTRPGTDVSLLEAIAGDAIDHLEECLGSGVVVPGGGRRFPARARADGDRAVARPPSAQSAALSRTSGAPIGADFPISVAPEFADAVRSRASRARAQRMGVGQISHVAGRLHKCPARAPREPVVRSWSASGSPPS